MKKRKWIYIMEPTSYEMSCDKCGGNNITWSEFEHLIWCYDCKIDTKGTEGIFGGPIPFEVSKILGISFDRLYLKDRSIRRMKVGGNRIMWKKEEDSGLAVNLTRNNPRRSRKL
jgi:hypothetical protein